MKTILALTLAVGGVLVLLHVIAGFAVFYLRQESDDEQR